MDKDKSIDLYTMINNKKQNKSIDLEIMSGGDYKQLWYKKNSKKVKNYNKEYYEKHKEKIRKNALLNYKIKKNIEI